MGARVPAVTLVVLAAAADSVGSHAVALDFLLLAVPLTAVAAIVVFGEYLDTRRHGARAALWGIATFLLVFSCAVRNGAGGVPAISRTAVYVCLAIFAIRLFDRAWPYLRNPAGAVRPIKP